MSSQPQEELHRSKLRSNWVPIKENTWHQAKHIMDLLFQGYLIDTCDVNNIKTIQDDLDKIDYMLMKVLEGNKCQTFFDILAKNGICKQGNGSALEWNVQGESKAGEERSKKIRDLEKLNKVQEKKWEQEREEREQMWEEHTKERDETWEKHVKEVEDGWRKYVDEEEKKWDNVRDELCESKTEAHVKLELQMKQYYHLQVSFAAARNKINDMTANLKERQSKICELESELKCLKEIDIGSDLATTVETNSQAKIYTVEFKKQIDDQYGRTEKKKQQTEEYEEIKMKENQIKKLYEEIKILKGGIIDSKASHLKITKYRTARPSGKDAQKIKSRTPRK